MKKKLFVFALVLFALVVGSAYAQSISPRAGIYYGSKGWPYPRILIGRPQSNNQYLVQFLDNMNNVQAEWTGRLNGRNEIDVYEKGGWTTIKFTSSTSFTYRATVYDLAQDLSRN